LDLKISEALNQRSPDFPGVVICTASDSLGTLLQLIKKRRVHRLVVVEGDVSLFALWFIHAINKQLRRKNAKAGREAVYLGSSPSPTSFDTSLAKLALVNVKKPGNLGNLNNGKRKEPASEPQSPAPGKTIA
jgi:hypothetical protein